MTTLTLARARPDRQPLDRRRAAIAVGVLYITGTAAGILSVVATGGGRIEGPDHVADAASLGRGLPTGAVLTLVMAGFSIPAAIALVVWGISFIRARRQAAGKSLLLDQEAFDELVALLRQLSQTQIQPSSSGQ